MATIEYVRDGAAPLSRATKALAQGVVAAGLAPAVMQGQPWRWRLSRDVAELRVERVRRHGDLDPDDRLLTIACGGALYHALTALTGAGVGVQVARLPDPADADLIARLRVTGFDVPGPVAVRQQQAMALRGAGQQVMAGVDLPVAVLDRLRDAAEAHGAQLRVLSGDELRRRVRAPRIHVRYALLSAGTDTRPSWLALGEALSAVLVTATIERVEAWLAVAPHRGSHCGLVLGVAVPDRRLRVKPAA